TVESEETRELTHKTNIGLAFFIWRTIMETKIAKLAAAAVIIIAVLIGLHYSGDSIDIAVPAYGIEQTVKALGAIKTVHMFCRDWNGTEFEMWMQLDKDGYPQYCRSYWPAYQVTDISTPDKSYQYNKKLQRVIVNTGKLYNFDFSFYRMFENLLAAAKQYPEKVTIHRQSNNDKALIVITADMGHTAWKLFINPESKLPASVYCLKSNQPGSFIKDVHEIYYDEPLPSGIFEFEIPEGVRVRNADDRGKLLNDPNYGWVYEDLTKQQAAEEIASKYWQAVIDSDLGQMKKYYPDTGTNANYTMEEFNAEYKECFGDFVEELVEVGGLYVEHNCGLGKLLPCILKLENGNLVECKIIIKFRKIDGVQSCVIAGFYGSPVKVK
ncbi:MAG: hypothetical protein DRP62_06085, partial [Planctomycetota bacterium]